MIKKLKKLLSPKPKQEKKDFSSFFNGASVQERATLMEDVARKANNDQRMLMEQQFQRSNQ
jgi:hypothetical protein